MTALPSWDQFMVPVLRLHTDGEVRSLRSIRTGVASATLTEDQRAEVLPSGSAKSDNRIGWAVSYLYRVGALERQARGQYRITDIGRRILADHPQGITEVQLRQHARPGDTWWVAKAHEPAAASPVTATPEIDPTEQVEEGIARIHADVAAELLTRLHANDPAFFEQAVLDLLVAMGYGGADGRATRTQLSNDGGIDGIIDQDALGLSRVYVQAKRYALDTSVGRPEIQGFVGALHGQSANQGVFITTGRFGPKAREYADGVATRVVLIDGQRLAALMIRYGVGVQVRRSVQIVEVDEDFFE
ncbi:restriction endonuclease [Janibacter hoylei]|uniref:restriction endonuclease n=1 Tax=Janibacter hoylei TaxID=364298 RepID=UPI0022385F1E|nr:restriction endonuclease [Janibacter hoylei]MCW4601564.1 restriction endonuclease [Janibacter hoylei]